MADYNPEEFWERGHSEVPSTEVKLGAGVHHVGGGISDSEAETLYVLRSVNMQRVLRKLALKAAPLVFELGSGGGYWARFFMDLKPSLFVGSDLSGSAVARLRSEFSDAKFIEMNRSGSGWLEIMGYGPFDLCLAIDVLYHITDDELWREALTQLCKNCRAGGHILIADYFYTQPYGMPSSQHVKFRKLQDYLNILHENQFVVEHIQPIFYLLNRGVSGPWRDHNRLVSVILRILLSNRIGLSVLAALDWLLTLVARPMDPKCKTRLLVARKSEGTSDHIQ